jgi:signal transduction histidine kinase
VNAAAATAEDPLRVVVIDDTADLRQLMRIALTRGGMEVVGEAGNGLDGIATVRSVRPDVVLLDLSMPVMDGLEALPQIRQLIPDGTIIMLSGFGASQMAKRALASGADGYIQKGMSLAGILDYVRDLALDSPGPSVRAVAETPPAESVDELRRTVAVTAHEIRGPVTVLKALAETLANQDVADDPAQRAALMASVARQARLLDGITGDLLVMAQAERGTLQLDRRPVDPVEVIRAVLSDEQVDADVVVLDARSVEADPLRLQQMVGNLVRNAVKHGAHPIEVTVRPDPVAALVAIDVADHGPGVPEEFRGRLFDEFARAPGTTAAGIGLGLHVVRSLADRHGGAVSYRPREGGGAVFTLRIPAVSPVRRVP